MTTLLAGAAAMDITPQKPIEIQGHLGDELSTGVFEKLYAKALVLDDGREKSVLVTSDLIGVSPELTASLRQGIARIVRGIKPANIMISAAHTHCAPTIVPGLVGRDRVNREYIRYLKSKVLAAVRRAVENLEPARIGTAGGKAFFNINRRLKTPQGVVMAPNPRGVCDHEVGVIRVDGLDGRPRAILMNFTCHPTVWGGTEISPDYPGFAQKTVEAKFPGTVALFTNGADGDVRPFTTRGKNPKTFGGGEKKWVVKLGTILGKEVCRVAAKIKTRPGLALQSAARTFRMPLGRQLPLAQLKEEVRQAQARVQQVIDEKKPSMWMMYEQIGLDWARKAYRLAKTKQFEPWVPFEVQLLAIGDIVLVGLSGEVFCDIGLAIKRGLKPRKAFVVGYANGCVGYVPTARALAEGGYESNESIRNYMLPARFSPRAEELLLKTVSQLKRAKINS